MANMDDIRDRLFQVIEDTPNLDWLLLTKRPENVGPVLARMGRSIPANVWLGTTVENQEQADLRVPVLLSTTAAVRFLSVEPMLGPIDLRAWIGDRSQDIIKRRFSGLPYERSFIHWIIVGGESGHKARPFDLVWARSIRDQCRVAYVPFFMKQYGSNPYDSSGPGVGYCAANMIELKNSHGGDWDEWPEDLRIREFPAASEVIV